VAITWPVRAFNSKLSKNNHIRLKRRCIFRNTICSMETEKKGKIFRSPNLFAFSVKVNLNWVTEGLALNHKYQKRKVEKHCTTSCLYDRPDTYTYYYFVVSGGPDKNSVFQINYILKMGSFYFPTLKLVSFNYSENIFPPQFSCSVFGHCQDRHPAFCAHI